MNQQISSDTVKDKSATQGRTTASVVAKWTSLTDVEWRALANALADAFPERHFRTAATFDIGNEEFNAIAQTVLPENRRPPKALSMVKIKPLLYEVYRLMRAGTPDGTVGADAGTAAKEASSQDPVKASFPNPAPTERSPVMLDASIPVLDLSASGSEQRKKKVFLKLADWYQIALKLEEQNPHSAFAKSTTLSGLSAAAINRALASALPAEKRRTFIALKEPKEKLLEAFKIINAERTLLSKQENDLKAIEGRIKASAPTSTPDAPAALANPYEAAFAPLMGILAREVANILMPQIAALLQEHVSPSNSTPSTQANQTVEDTHALALSRETRKPLVGVVGPLPEQANRLREAFPELNIVCIESSEHKRVRSLQNCIKVLGMTKFMSHPIESSVKKLVKDRYVRVDGGPESIKRHIQILQASGALHSYG